MRVLYFAWVRERVGVAEEELEPPAEVTTVGAGGVAGERAARAMRYAFENPGVVRAALDKVHAQPETRSPGRAKWRSFLP